MLQSNRINDPTDRKGGKLFRRRFRVPYPIYLQIVDTNRASGLFTESPDAAGNPAAPLELKILSVLRVLGRGYCFDGVEELTCISAEVLRLFFKKFCEYFARENFARYCNLPSTPEGIANYLEIFGRLGLPGCIGSTDCVHIRWERCHANQRSNHKGKEDYFLLSQHHHQTSPVPWYNSASVGQGELTHPSWLRCPHHHRPPRLRNHHLQFIDLNYNVL